MCLACLTCCRHNAESVFCLTLGWKLCWYEGIITGFYVCFLPWCISQWILKWQKVGFFLVLGFFFLNLQDDSEKMWKVFPLPCISPWWYSHTWFEVSICTSSNHILLFMSSLAHLVIPHRYSVVILNSGWPKCKCLYFTLTSNCKFYCLLSFRLVVLCLFIFNFYVRSVGKEGSVSHLTGWNLI